MGLETGRSCQIDVKGRPTGDGTLDDPYLVGLYSVNNYILHTENDGGGTGGNSQFTFTVPTDASITIFNVAVGAYGDDDRGTYRVSVKDVTDTFTDDFTTSRDTTGVVDVEGSVTGEIESPGDLDWFAVDLTGGTTYQIDLKGLGTRDGTLWDTYLVGVYNSSGSRIYDMAGDRITDDDGGEGVNSRVTFTPTATGTHYVSAGGIGSETGTYTLSVSVKDVTNDDDHSATTQTPAGWMSTAR